VRVSCAKRNRSSERRTAPVVSDPCGRSATRASGPGSCCSRSSCWSRARVDAARRRMRGLLLPGQRRVHAAKESARRRRVLLDTVGSIEGLSATILRYRRPVGTTRIGGRHLLLQAATGLVVGSGVSSWVLDDQDTAQRVRDRVAIAHALTGVSAHLHPVYDHCSSASEPLLWVADALCWAVGVGGDWHRRVNPVLTLRDIRP
jgi:hypothetical protein